MQSNQFHDPNLSHAYLKAAQCLSTLKHLVAKEPYVFLAKKHKGFQTLGSHVAKLCRTKISLGNLYCFYALVQANNSHQKSILHAIAAVEQII